MRISHLELMATKLTRAHLGVPRVGVEDVAEELACHCHAGDDEPVNVVHVNRENLPTRLLRQLHHPVEVNQQRQENFVAGRAVLLDAGEVCL